MYTITFSVPTLDVLTQIADAVKMITASKNPTPVTAEKTVAAKAEPKQEVIPPKGKNETKETVPAFLGKKDAKADKELLEEAKNATLALVKISRETAVAVLKQFGVPTATALKPEQYADFLKAANEVLENHTKQNDLI